VTGYIDAMLGALTVIEADDAPHGASVPPVPVIFAGGPWSSRPADKILASPQLKTFLALLFEHTIEGMYGNPEYGGNRGLAGWKEIGYPGDSQPTGYTDQEVERSDGPDPVEETRVVADVLKLLGAL
jgi:hypothetical protein